MMNKKLINILSPILILVMLPATSGVSIFHHICHSEGTHMVSLYTESKCDHDEETTGVCEHCQKNIKSCSIDGFNNCIQYVDYLSIDADFLTSSKLIIQPDFLISNDLEIYKSAKSENKKQDIILQYFKLDIKNPIINEISFIIFKSQDKSSAKPSNSIFS